MSKLQYLKIQKYFIFTDLPVQQFRRRRSYWFWGLLCMGQLGSVSDHRSKYWEQTYL